MRHEHGPPEKDTCFSSIRPEASQQLSCVGLGITEGVSVGVGFAVGEMAWKGVKVTVTAGMSGICRTLLCAKVTG